MKLKFIMPLLIGAALLSGCTHARHSQCQDLASQADGAQIGAAMSGTFYGQRQANIAQLEYNQCEQQMSAIDYARGSVAPQDTQAIQSPKAQDVKFTSLTGRDVAYMSNGALIVNGQSYQFIKSMPPTPATKDETDGIKKGDLLAAELYANSVRTSGAMIGTNSTQGKMYITTFDILNGKPDMKQGDANEIEVKQGSY